VQESAQEKRTGRELTGEKKTIKKKRTKRKKEKRKREKQHRNMRIMFLQLQSAADERKLSESNG